MDGAETNEAFNFKISFSGEGANIEMNSYPYQIQDKEGTVLKSGDISSGDTFQLSHEQSIVVFNLPEGTKYIIEEDHYSGYAPDLGEGSTGIITKDETVEGDINWDRDDELNYINKEVPYNLPETGGPGTNVYTMAGALSLLFGAGLMYRKKFRGRRV